MSPAIHGAAGYPVNFDASFVVSVWFYPLYVAIAALPFLFFRPAVQRRDPLNPYFATSLLLFLYTVSALRAFQQTGLAATVPNVTLSAIGKFALVCLVGQLGLAMGEITGLLGARHAGRTYADSDDRFNLAVLTGPALLVALAALPFYIERFNF